MKKTLLSVLALFTFTLCNAIVKTQSNYDVDGNGKVTIEEKLGISTPSTPDTPEPTDPYNGHEYIDLGLPSGLKWATCNVGANKPEEYGDHFAWGETEPYYTEGHSQDKPCSNWKTNKTGYDWASYNWCNGSYDTQTKYCTSSSYGTVDNKTVLDPEDDAAHVNWGGNWRMPTKEEQDELRTNCIWTWGAQNGVSGYTVVGPNGNSIFLPAAGCRWDSVLYGVGSSGLYWSSSLYSSFPNYACYLLFNFNSGGVDRDYYGRYGGHSVRAVCP